MTDRTNPPWEELYPQPCVVPAKFLGVGVFGHNKLVAEAKCWWVQAFMLESTRWDRIPHLVRAILIGDNGASHETWSLLGEFEPLDVAAAGLFNQLRQALRLCELK